MKVPFELDDGTPVCQHDMTSIPALDMSFEHDKKFYKVTYVIENTNDNGVVIGYDCTVKLISRKRYEE
jgi:hypothetical protein